ncbi:MAG: type II toxin-antitoxin system VapB family antitoxin [Actinomycetota bacterium]|nr:type II toxin-antitoxin system VapB family antitoxin [Actinomycetota bacterium]
MAEKRRTTIEVDDDLVARARAALGTRGLKDTIDAALHEAIRSDRRRALIARLRSGRGVDLDPDALAEVRRWRTS